MRKSPTSWRRDVSSSSSRRKAFTRLEVLLLVLSGVFAFVTVSALFSILNTLPSGISGRDGASLFHLFDRSSALEGFGTGAYGKESASTFGGDGQGLSGLDNTGRGGGGRRGKKGGKGTCWRPVFKFYTNLTSSASVDLSPPPSFGSLTGRDRTRGSGSQARALISTSGLLWPSFESWITHGDSRYAHNVNLEVDAVNRTRVYAAWQASDTHEGAKDQIIQLAVSHDRGRKWHVLPSRVTTSSSASGGATVPLWNPILHSRRNGDLVLFYAQSRSKCRVKGRSDWFTPGGDIRYVVSKDGGLTFSDSEVAVMMRRSPLTPTGNLVVMKEGKKELWILPVAHDSKASCATSGSGGASKHLYNGPGLVYSRNYGKTWNFSQSLPLNPDLNGPGHAKPKGEDGLDPNEDIRDGSIILADRSSSGQMLQFSRSSRGHVYKGRTFNFGKDWSSPKEIALPNADSKVSAFHAMDGTLVLAYNNSTRKGHLSTLMLAACFDNEGQDWSNVAMIEDSPRTAYANPSMAQLRLGTRAGPLLVGYSVAETIFGHFRSGMYQYRGIKLASVNLNLPRMYIRRGKQAISFRSSKLSFDMNADEDKRPQPAAPCLSMHHPSLFALFKSSLTDRAEISVNLGMQLKVKPATRQVKGKAMYSGLGTEDYSEIYFNTNSNITHRLFAVKTCSPHCNIVTLEKESTNLLVIWGVFASNAENDEYESPVLASFKMAFSDRGDGTNSKVITVDVDAEKRGDWFHVNEELKVVISRSRPKGRAGASRSYDMDVFFGEDHVTSFSWLNMQPSFLNFGCSRSIQGVCAPRNAGLCARSISTKFVWHVQDLTISTKNNQCAG